jgi:hypothetical protein
MASMLAFWTGRNHERIRTIMQGSALVRDKWTKHKKYLAMTISNSVNSCKNIYGVREQVEIPEPVIEGLVSPIARTGVQFMPASQQLEYFKDCIYIKQTHRVLVPNGAMLKPEVFKATYAGYTFALDAENQKTTKNAFEALIDNQAIRFPRVDGTCFRPQLPAYALVTDEQHQLVNTFVPLNVARKVGDVSPFLIHMKKLFPIADDYNVIMAYMAALVQYQGHKFQWCPILQGAEGNGKTMIGRILANAVGWRYSHFPNASDLGGNGLKFNGWVMSKTLIFINEIYTSDRNQLTEPLKTLITDEKIDIQFKGQDQFTGDNMANFIMCSNHKDCMRMTYDTRRYWMYFCPQQSAKDLINDGMGQIYFRDLYNWLKADGYAMCTEYLYTYSIPNELNPAVDMQRAPTSSSLSESVRISLGTVEQHILEAIQDERPGFKGGYISSKAFKDLLIEIRLDGKITPQRRIDILESLGYVKHPWLRDGRVNNPIAAEGAKIRIYTNLDLSELKQISALDIKDQYEQAQEYIVKPLEVVK